MTFLTRRLSLCLVAAALLGTGMAAHAQDALQTITKTKKNQDRDSDRLPALRFCRQRHGTARPGH